MNKHNYSLTEIENMIPWERDTYVAMLISSINEENNKTHQKNLRNS